MLNSVPSTHCSPYIAKASLCPAFCPCSILSPPLVLGLVTSCLQPTRQHTCFAGSGLWSLSWIGCSSVLANTTTNVWEGQLEMLINIQSWGLQALSLLIITIFTKHNWIKSLWSLTWGHFQKYTLKVFLQLSPRVNKKKQKAKTGTERTYKL